MRFLIPKVLHKIVEQPILEGVVESIQFAYGESGVRIEDDTDVQNVLEKSRTFFCER